MSGATKAVAANSAIFPLVTAQIVAFERGLGGWVSRLRTVGGYPCGFFRQATVNGKTPEQRLAARREKSKPLSIELEIWMRRQRASDRCVRTSSSKLAPLEVGVWELDHTNSDAVLTGNNVPHDHGFGSRCCWAAKLHRVPTTANIFLH
jgi:hypothetical protein